MTPFQKKIKAFKHGKTIRQISRESGVSISYISMLMNGILKNDPSRKIAIKLANVLTVSPTQRKIFLGSLGSRCRLCGQKLNYKCGDIK